LTCRPQSSLRRNAGGCDIKANIAGRSEVRLQFWSSSQRWRLIATLWMPVLRIYGSSMSPTLQDGQIVVSIKSSRFEPGDIAAFYHGNKLLIKRYIAGPGQWVDIDENGNVFVDGSLLDEPYLMEKAYGQTNIELPYQVPDERYFLMGDNRDVSVDSRNTTVGCVSTEQIVGKVIFNVFGPVY